MSVFNLIYVITASLLAMYGLNALILCTLFARHRSESQPTFTLSHFPHVTVQLPVFNEALVVDRLIKSVVQLDWPRDRLQIQVLDDSTDETTDIAAAYVNEYWAQGFDIELIHRSDRSGYKAGALREGLKSATGEYVAVFDADFLPGRDWLQRTVAYFIEYPKLGLVQTRWDHLNRDYSFLTQAQSIGLDGHFVVEQVARSRSGLLMNFNGTAGIWRRSCIDHSGGWHADTICEDLDLSFRAQMGGWTCMYLPEMTTKAEIPPQLAAFKRQQFRWAKGSIQCLRKLAKPLLTSDLPWPARLMGIIQLSGYMIHPLALLSLMIVLPLIVILRSNLVSLGIISLLSFGPPLMYALSQNYIYRQGWIKRLLYVPVLMMLGTGIALNNTRAVIEGLFGNDIEFQRTPKFRIEKQGDNWLRSMYTLPFEPIILGEMAVAAYATITMVAAATLGYVHIVPYLMLHVLGFSYVALLGLWESRLHLSQAFFKFLGRKRQPIQGQALPVLPSKEGARQPSTPEDYRRQPSTLSYRQPVSHISQR